MTELNADCARCAALCCRLAFFEKSDEFAFTKPSGVACRHLRADDGCAIHATRAERGLTGCISFDCHGAGQALSARLDGTESLSVAVAAFHALVEIHLVMRVFGSTEELEALAAMSPRALAEFERSRLRTLISGRVRLSSRAC